jgi:hypothetical protein
MLTDQHIQHELQTVESQIARLTEQTAQLEGERGRLMQMLTDNEGAHDRRAVAVR